MWQTVFRVSLLLLLISTALLRIWVSQELVHLGYLLSLEEALSTQMRSQHQALDIELAAFTSPARLSVIATAMGFQTPSSQQLLTIQAEHMPILPAHQTDTIGPAAAAVRQSSTATEESP